MDIGPRKVTLHGVFLRELNPYLGREIQGSNKTTENSERLDLQTRLAANPKPPVYQFRGQNLSIIGSDLKNRLYSVGKKIMMNYKHKV